MQRSRPVCITQHLAARRWWNLRAREQTFDSKKSQFMLGNTWISRMHVDTFIFRKHLRARVWDCKTGEEAGSCSSCLRPSQDDNTKTYLVSTCRSMIPPRVKTVSALSSISSGASGEERTCRCRRQELDPWARKVPWKRDWQPTPVLLPGEAHGQRSLAGYSLWGRKESDTTQQLRIYALSWLPVAISI